ncbi:MAG: hypothetical protein J6H20_05790 [Pyramidobacter sp.]|nr:hypothetical protein [Pyramidobacter sp.]MBP3752116.1 hypothetical protein [Pyramidobacter sp.]
MEFKLVTIDAKTPLERGAQHGEAAKDWILRGLEGYRKTFCDDFHQTWKSVQERAMAYVPFLEKDFADLLEEVRGIGVGAGVCFEDMMVLNTRYELLKFPVQECTSFAILPEATENGHAYLGMNWDNVPWMRDSSLLLHVFEPNGTRYLCMTEAGQLIRHGCNSFGVAIGTNNLLSTADSNGLGVPTNFMRRRVLTSTTLEEAVESVRRSPRSVSCNLMIGSPKGACDCEVNPDRRVELHPINGILTHANHFAAARDICRNKGANFRDVRLYSLLERKRGHIDVPFIQECLKDHFKADSTSHEAICKHTPLPGESIATNHLKASVTIASQIYDLTAKKAWICMGAPCEGTYKEYDV